MTKAEITEIYLRNIKRLESEISTYTSDESLWVLQGIVLNSGGNLALHLIGNLNHFIGATLGNTGYMRNRDAEFDTRNLTRATLLEMLEAAKSQVAKTLAELPEEALQKDYPYDFAGKHSSEYYLVFFIAHFECHLGQINYHRRML